MVRYNPWQQAIHSEELSPAICAAAHIGSRISMIIFFSLILSCILGCKNEELFALQPLDTKPTTITLEDSGIEAFYIPSMPDTVKWGILPNASDKALITVPSGSIVVFDTLSHEGILEDQGRDPIGFFKDYGVDENYILRDAILIAESNLNHDFYADGPHIVTGPIAIENAMPGDVLKVEILSLKPRVPYGVISNRHGKGALPGEFPETKTPKQPIHQHAPEALGNVSIFTPIYYSKNIERWNGKLKNNENQKVSFPTAPFMGVMGVAPNTTDKVHSVPPDVHGGNIDVKDFQAGSTLYLPIFVPGALFYTGDPHMAQGNGEVALTALEHSIRVTFKLSLLKQASPEIPTGTESISRPFGETEKFWITMGFDPDLDEAMKQTVREAIAFLEKKLNMDRATALAYLSAATDFNVSQVVDKNKGIHALIRKEDFSKITEEWE